MPKISVIIPIYNAEKYLDRCIQSLLNQTLKDIEIILVDDGSKDHSVQLCKRFAQQYANIRVICKKNEGAGRARRAGILASESKYITFLDSDDYYEPKYCEKMFNRMEHTKADLVECGYYIVCNDRREHHVFEEDKCMKKTEFINFVFRTTIVDGKEAVVQWNKLYRKDLILKAVKEYGNNVLEDYLFNLQYYSFVNMYCYIHDCLTNYQTVIGSLSRKCNLNTYSCLQKCESLKEQHMKDLGVISALDQENDATWFTRYTFRFLQSYYLADIPHSNEFVINIMKNEMLIKKCNLISYKNRFAKLIVQGKFKHAIMHIKRDIFLIRMRRYLSTIKRFLFVK